MFKIFASLVSACLMTVILTGVALAQSYTVPVTISGDVYTFTVTVDSGQITVHSDSPTVTIGSIAPLQTDEEKRAVEDTETLKSSAIAVTYDDLFRYNERYIGKIVRYVGKVLQMQEKSCLFCTNPGYVLRIAITKGSYGLWDDPVWVEYDGTDRFLEDDIVTVWGMVAGLETYSALLGNQVTIPKLTAIDLVLGDVKSTAPAASNATNAVAGAPVVNRNANLRGGPGTNYPVVGSVTTGQAVSITGRNSDGSWLQLDSGAWIATFLVDNPPASDQIPLATDIPTAPAEQTQAAAPTPAPVAAANPSKSIVGIGEELHGKGWRFKVKEIHKRKTVYFYDNAYVASGHFLVVIIDAVSENSGTTYFADSIKPYLTDDPGNRYTESSKGTSYASWQYEGIATVYTDVNPGNFVRIAMAFDLPESVGHVLLSTDLPAWIDLGDFAAMQIDDKK